MIILNTDALSLLDREKLLASSTLRENLERFTPDEIFTTIITFEEQMRGWLLLSLEVKTQNSRFTLIENCIAFGKLSEHFRFRLRRKIRRDFSKSQISKNSCWHNGFENRFDCNCQQCDFSFEKSVGFSASSKSKRRRLDEIVFNFLNPDG